jgi:hypothetical protein
MRKRWLLLAAGVVGVAVMSHDRSVSLLRHAAARAAGPYTVSERVEQFGADVDARLRAAFVSAGVDYPPRNIAFLAFKDQRTLDVYARNGADEAWRSVLRYPILAMSGELGPKTREGDLQVPEGVYRSEFLNANSRFHLSIRVNYPNAADRAIAAAERRDNLGGDIMIHGNSVSIGCLAMGDRVAEDLFVLAARAESPLPIVIAPVDFRVRDHRPPPSAPDWWQTRYDEIRAALADYPIPPEV